MTMFPVDTLLFVDVDGVLNVSIGDDNGFPLHLTEGNIQAARSMEKSLDRCLETDRQCVERTIATCARRLGHEENASYEKFSSDDDVGFSTVLVERLVLLIRSLDGRGSVILSSFWRKPKHAEKLAKLEAAISARLGRTFQFDGRTRIFNDNSPSLRLRAVGDYIASHCERCGVQKSLRVLVLDDFFCQGVDRWRAGDVSTIHEAEKYLESRAAPQCANARIVHTHESFITSSGMTVQLGCGLTLGHLQHAQLFLAQPALRQKQILGNPLCPEAEDQQKMFDHAQANMLASVTPVILMAMSPSTATVVENIKGFGQSVAIS